MEGEIQAMREAERDRGQGGSFLYALGFVEDGSGI
jgi:hypothetical protein